MRVLSRKKAVAFLLFSSFIFCFPGMSFTEVLTVEGPCLEMHRVSAEENEGSNNGTQVVERTCIIDALKILVLELLECQEKDGCFFNIFKKVGYCIIDCLNGADVCTDENSQILTISPSSAKIFSGESLSFSASGGTPPYLFTLSQNMSGAILSDNGENRAEYKAGIFNDVIDRVRVTDNASSSVEAEVSVTQADILAIIEPEGGRVSLSNEFTVDFPKDAVVGQVTCSISVGELPFSLPENTEVLSRVYQVALSGELQKPVTVSFSLDNADDGTGEIYEWDGRQWFYAGGYLRAGAISTQVNDLSAYIVGSGKKAIKSFGFQNVGNQDAQGSIYQYMLGQIDLAPPISSAYSWTLQQDDETIIYFPEGHYQFCVQWFDNQNRTWQKKLIGGGHPDYSHILNPGSNLNVPQRIRFNLIGTDIETGECPDSVNMGDIEI